MNIQGWLWVISCTAIVVAANVLLRISIVKSNVTLFSSGLAGLPGQILALVINPVFCIAVFLYMLSMLVWFRILATSPLSIAYPALAALTFISLTCASAFLFHEPMPIQKIVGIGITLIGLSLISAS